MKVNLLLLMLIFSTFYNAQLSWVSLSPTFPNGYNQVTNYVLHDNLVWLYSHDNTNKKMGFSKSLDNGSTFQNAGEYIYGTGYYYIHFTAVDGNTAFLLLMNASTLTAQIMKTTDGGTTWSNSGSLPNFPNFIHFADSNNGFVICDANSATSNFLIYRTTDGGQNWTLVPQANMPPTTTYQFTVSGGDVEYFDTYQTNYWFGTGAGKIYKSQNNGLNWSVINTPYTTLGEATANSLGTFSWQDANNGYLLNGMGEAQKTTDGGITWTPVTSPTSGGGNTNYIKKIPSSNILLFAGQNNSKYSTDNGASWSLIGNNGLRLIKSKGESSTFAIGSQGELYKLSMTSLSLNETSMASKSQLYPNPSSDFVVLKDLKPGSYVIYDQVGRVVGKGNYTLNQKINIQHFNSGNYTIKTDYGYYKFIKK